MIETKAGRYSLLSFIIAVGTGIFGFYLPWLGRIMCHSDHEAFTGGYIPLYMFTALVATVIALIAGAAVLVGGYAGSVKLWKWLNAPDK